MGQLARSKAVAIATQFGCTPSDIVFDISQDEIIAIAAKSKSSHALPLLRYGSSEPLSITVAHYVDTDTSSVVRSTVVLADRISGRQLMRREVWEEEGCDDETPHMALVGAISDIEHLIDKAGLSDDVYRLEVGDVPLHIDLLAAGTPSAVTIHDYFTENSLDESFRFTELLPNDNDNESDQTRH